MKTIIILLVLAYPVYYALRKVVRLFTKQESSCSCSSCPSKTKSNCHSKK